MSVYAPNFTAACMCGASKEKGALFCDPCYFRLPKEIQGEINTRINDFKSTAEKASEHLVNLALGGEQP